MDIFFKATAGILIALVLYLILVKQGKDYSVLLTLFVCCCVSIAALHYLDRVIGMLRNLQTVGKLDGDTFQIILRAVGIGILAEITSAICADAGNAALGKTMQFLASALVLWISVPLFESLISLVEEILVAV